MKKGVFAAQAAAAKLCSICSAWPAPYRTADREPLCERHKGEK